MKAQIFKYWINIRSSFWFIPIVMSVGAMLLAYTTVALNETITDWLRYTWDWTFTGGAEGASAVLSTIAGSMITIAGVVFSITLVVLSLVSSQLGPRLLRNFMSDTTTQVVLGTFVATFLYCLLVLRTIRREEEVVFVPHLSVTLGVVFAVVSVGVLIYFIHHISLSIRANQVVARIGKELDATIERLYLDHREEDAPRKELETPGTAFMEMVKREARSVNAGGGGYLQFVDREELTELAMQEDADFLLEKQPGNYVFAGDPLLMVWPGNRVSDKLTKQVNLSFAKGHERTSSQDIEFTVLQLVEIGLRALSPSLNDPFTATACVNQLGSALCRLAQRDTPSPFLFDKQNRFRVFAPALPFSVIADAAFNQIRQNCRSNVPVTIRLLETIAVVATFAHRREDRSTLLRHAEMIARGARDGLPEELDRWAVEEHFQTVRKLCTEHSELEL